MSNGHTGDHTGFYKGSPLLEEADDARYWATKSSEYAQAAENSSNLAKGYADDAKFWAEQAEAGATGFDRDADYTVTGRWQFDRNLGGNPDTVARFMDRDVASGIVFYAVGADKFEIRPRTNGVTYGTRAFRYDHAAEKWEFLTNVRGLTPVEAADIATKGYVDAVGGAGFDPASNQTITGNWGFTQQVTIPSTPVAATDAASKGYVDLQVGGGFDPTSDYTITGTHTHESQLVLANNVWLRAKEAGGTVRDILRLTSADELKLGNALFPMEMRASVSPTWFDGAATHTPAYKEDAETIAGAWTFSALPTVPLTPTADGHAASKKYVDDEVAAGGGGFDTSDDYVLTGSWRFTLLTEFDLGALFDNNTGLFFRNAAETASPLVAYMDGSDKVHFGNNGYATFIESTDVPVWRSDPAGTNDKLFAFKDANETVSGSWTFGTAVSVPLAPSLDAHAASKKYVDDELAAFVGFDPSANQTITGTWTFTQQVTVPTTPVATTDAASKSYVDSVGASGFDPASDQTITGDWDFTQELEALSFKSTSSIALKENVREFSDEDRFMALRPVIYSRKADPESRDEIGLILEEAREVYPEICGERGIDYSRLSVVLLAELQRIRDKLH